MRCKNHDGSVAAKYLGKSFDKSKHCCYIEKGRTTKQPRTRSWIKFGICTNCAKMIFPEEFSSCLHSAKGQLNKNNSLNPVPLLSY